MVSRVEGGRRRSREGGREEEAGVDGSKEGTILTRKTKVALT